jgi:beta-glucosidase
LPVTFYQSADQLPPFDDYSMKGRTYRYFQGEPLYAFGFGLSYTTFAYSRLDCPERAPANHDVPVSVEVRNTGKLAGEEVVQLYVKHDGVRSLEGFRRIALKAGERRIVKFVLKARQLPKSGVAGSPSGGRQPGGSKWGVLTTTLSIAP